MSAEYFPSAKNNGIFVDDGYRPDVPGLPDREHMRWKYQKQDRIHAREMAALREQRQRRVGNIASQLYMHAHGNYTDPYLQEDDRRSEAS